MQPTPACSLASCERPSTDRKGLCEGHYNRLRRWGDVREDMPLGYRFQAPTCSIEDCERKSSRKGYCDSHYRRHLKAGNPQSDLPLLGDRTPEAMYALHVVKQQGECWGWTGPVNNDGYATLGRRIDGKSRHQFAHRVSYAMHVEPIPKDLVIDHLCRNRSCTNPDHLEAVTAAENSARVAWTAEKQFARVGLIRKETA